MLETIALVSGLILGVIVALILWLIWMAAGLLLFLSQANHPTGGKHWLSFGGIAIMLAGFGGAGWSVYWVASSLFR